MQLDLTGFYPIVFDVSNVTTQVLAGDRFQCIKRPEENAYVRNLGVNENLLYLPLKLVWIPNNEASSKYTNRCSISHNVLKSVRIAMWLFVMSF